MGVRWSGPHPKRFKLLRWEEATEAKLEKRLGMVTLGVSSNVLVVLLKMGVMDR